MIDNTNKRLIENAFKNLIDEIKIYRPGTPLTLIEDAYHFAKDAHEGQLRKTGEPYVIHPLAVALILAQMRSDLESIAAGILHDVVEDTSHTLEEIASRFGAEIAQLVDGVTKIKQVKYVSKTPDNTQQPDAESQEVKLSKSEKEKLAAKADEQAENYRKLFFHMSQDIRVLIIKIADRLHNMRTLGGHREDKQKTIAQETLDLYSPLAHRLGIAKIRYELEDLAFKYQDRTRYNELSQKIQMKQSERQAVVQEVVDVINNKLKAEGINAVVEGRAKHFYSLHRKMKNQDKTLDQIYDLFAVRVLVNEVTDCYAVLGWVHTMFTPVPGRIKDYISMPKINRYQSLHTTIMGPYYGEPVEVQIRTHEMHQVAEFGIAAHWKYKERDKTAKDKWLTEIMTWQRELSDNQEYLAALKMDLDVFRGQVYCFTPNGDVYTLVDGATPIDFAYTIHSAVGNRMIGAKVNGRIVTNDYTLLTGDRVEILTSQNTKGPSRDWINIVKTAQARTKINQWFKRQDREENIQKGRELLDSTAAELGITFDVLMADDRDKDILNRFNCKELNQLYAMVGVGGIKEKQIINRLYREYEKTLPPPSDEELIKILLTESANMPDRKTQNGIVIKGLGDTSVRFARCCSPVPGDEIIGFVTRGRGMSVHRTDCVNIIHLDELDKRRLMDTQWSNQEKTGNYHTDIRILCDDRDGLLADISRILADEKVKVTSMNVRTNSHNDAIFNVGLEIPDGERLNQISQRLLREKSVYEITRAIS
ncbi:MAG: bifunctional (p)ppGpp synthetase/guanosine-3',5'-bis(diphosphate) 3'-pyrophosphohydrolase [Defluviitaleaceae bacterium]|nr:bifunctional (p)ppGpp synthetase/guanosine-3',5'-bis(diphosphate) 3'-pyrophosphohydrolase [Defluviitaleaceae bacterium]